jgi:DNA-binding NarL/FixJ family response regulator
MATKLFITDDHYMVIEGIRSLLTGHQDIEWIGHAMNAESCLAFLQRQLPDVILMDISLPDRSGLDLCKEVKAKYPSVHVIALSSFNQQSFIQNMMHNGASGYVLKNATKEELEDAIKSVMAGKNFLSPEAASAITNSTDSGIPVITKRETQVLGMIAEGLTNAEIAEKLFVSVTTIDTHRKNLLLKFEAKNTATLIKKAASYHLI